MNDTESQQIEKRSAQEMFVGASRSLTDGLLFTPRLNQTLTLRMGYWPAVPKDSRPRPYCRI